MTVETRVYTCIVCPNGCRIQAEIADSQIFRLAGAGCARGEEYVRQEVLAPMRNIASSVLVKGGELPLASVRLSGPIPRDRIFDAMEEIKKVKLDAPVEIGQVALENLLGLGVNVIVTKNVGGACGPLGFGNSGAMVGTR